MGDKSSIEWLRRPDGTEGASWNHVVGCDHVSEGCDFCYAARNASGRLSKTPTYIGLASGGRFNGTVRLLPERLGLPLRWRKGRRIFVTSMSDLFHKDVPDEYIAATFAVMAMAPQHTFIIFTKRPGRMRSLLSSPRFPEMVKAALIDLRRDHPRLQIQHARALPLPNVWLGVSAENQHWADIRIPALLDTPATVHAVSLEPLLGPIDLGFLNEVDHCNCAGGAPESGYIHERYCGLEPGPTYGGLHWVIVGGESGPRARPMHPAWARSLRDQCQAAGVPFFFKQFGEWAPAPWRVERELGESVEDYKARAEAVCATHAHTGNSYQENGKTIWHHHEAGHKPWSLERQQLLAPAEAIRRVGRAAAGHELDGQIWDQAPVEAAMAA